MRPEEISTGVQGEAIRLPCAGSRPSIMQTQACGNCWTPRRLGWNTMGMPPPPKWEISHYGCAGAPKIEGVHYAAALMYLKEFQCLACFPYSSFIMTCYINVTQFYYSRVALDDIKVDVKTRGRLAIVVGNREVSLTGFVGLWGQFKYLKKKFDKEFIQCYCRGHWLMRRCYSEHGADSEHGRHSIAEWVTRQSHSIWAPDGLSRCDYLRLGSDPIKATFAFRWLTPKAAAIRRPSTRAILRSILCFRLGANPWDWFQLSPLIIWKLQNWSAEWTTYRNLFFFLSLDIMITVLSSRLLR